MSIKIKVIDLSKNNINLQYEFDEWVGDKDIVIERIIDNEFLDPWNDITKRLIIFYHENGRKEKLKHLDDISSV